MLVFTQGRSPFNTASSLGLQGLDFNHAIETILLSTAGGEPSVPTQVSGCMVLNVPVESLTVESW